MLKWVVAAGLLLGGCAPSVTQVGPRQYAIEKCRSASACWAAANKQCPAGFDVLGADAETSMFVQDYGSGVTTVTPVTRRELIVKCHFDNPEEP